MRFKNIFTIFMIITLSFTGIADAMDYVSLNGGFSIELPDNWKQIDYNTVDLFLSKNTDDPNIFNYEAVFANETNTMFFLGDYLILKIDKFKQMTDRIRDSVLTNLGVTYENKVENGYLEHFVEDPIRDVPIYDIEKKTASVLRKMFLPDGSVKYNLMFFKFTDSGVVNFFFYSPHKNYQESKFRYLDVIKSFSTENIKSKLPKEDVEVADIDIASDDERDRTEFDDGSSGGGMSIGAYIAIFAGLLVVAIGITRRKKRT